MPQLDFAATKPQMIFIIIIVYFTYMIITTHVLPKIGFNLKLRNKVLKYNLKIVEELKELDGFIKEITFDRPVKKFLEDVEKSHKEFTDVLEKVSKQNMNDLYFKEDSKKESAGSFFYEWSTYYIELAKLEEDLKQNKKTKQVSN